MVTLAQLTHHRSAVVRSELRAMLEDLHLQYGVCGQVLVPSTTFAMHGGNTWVDTVLRAMGTLGIGLLMPLSVYSCLLAHLPQVQWAGHRWVTRSYTFKGRDIRLLSGPRTDAAVRSLTDPANGTHGSRATNLRTRLISSGTVTRTICTFRTRGLGPPSWTTYGSRDSRRSSNRGCPVP